MLSHLFGHLPQLPWWNWTLQIVGLVASYLGAELNARKRVTGFYVWLVANVVLFCVHCASGIWILAVLDVLYFRINLMGIRKWKSIPETALESA